MGQFFFNFYFIDKTSRSYGLSLYAEYCNLELYTKIYLYFVTQKWSYLRQFYRMPMWINMKRHCDSFDIQVQYTVKRSSRTFHFKYSFDINTPYVMYYVMYDHRDLSLST